MFVSPFASLDLALHKDERFSTQDEDRKEETFLAQQSSSPSLYLEPLPSSPPCTILIGDQEPLKKENSWAMDFLEASTLEELDPLHEHGSFFLENPQETCSFDSSLESSPVKHDPKHELENFFLEHPQETCSCHESLEPTPLSAKTPHEAYNHLVYLISMKRADKRLNNALKKDDIPTSCHAAQSPINIMGIDTNQGLRAKNKCGGGSLLH
ncbi:hypothetical protein EJB05_40851, partial [Eragrostis curvula]